MRAGVSQRDLAFPGCSSSYISRLEKGNRIPSLQLLRELALRLGVSTEYLATGAHDGSHDPVAEAELTLRLAGPEVARDAFVRIAETARDRRTRARALAGLGQIAFERGDHDDSIRWFERALLEWPPLEEEDAALADSLGRSYALTSRYGPATMLFERRLAAAEERGDTIETIRFSVLLANTYADRGDFAAAQELLGLALSHSRALRDPVTRARVWWSQSRVHSLRNDAERAERYARLALHTLLLTDHVRYAAQAHQVLAHIKLDLGEADEALELLEQGFPFIVESGNVYDQAMFRVDQARARLALGQVDDAQACAEEALEKLAGTSPIDSGRALAVLGEVHARRGNTEQAVDCFRRAAETLPIDDRYKLEAHEQLAELERGAPQS